MTQKILCQGAEAIIYLVSPRSKKSLPLIKSSRRSLTKSASEQLISEQSEDKFIIKDRISKTYRIKELDEQIRSRRTRSESKLLFKASQIITSPAPFFPLCIKGSTKIKMPFIDGKRLSEHLDNFTLDKQKKICKKIGENISKLHNQGIIHGDLTTSNMILVEHPTSTNHLSKKISPLIKPKKITAHSCSQIHQKFTNKKSKTFSLINKGGGERFCEGENKFTDNRARSRIGVDGGISESNFLVYFIDFGLGFISHKFEDKAVDLHLLKQALEAKHFKHWETLFNEVVNGYKKTRDAKIIFERLKAVEKRGRYK